MSLLTPQAGVSDVSNQNIACECPKVLEVRLDFTTFTTWDVDLSYLIDRGALSAVQSVYIDNGLNANAITLQCEVTNQRITLLANRQGYFPIALPNPPKFRVTAAGGISRLHLFNVPMPVGVWPTA